jgi:hypothetical protein
MAYNGQLHIKQIFHSEGLLCCSWDFSDVVQEASGIQGCWGVLIKNPPVSMANAELVLDLGACLGIYLLLERVLAVLVGGIFHLLGVPMRVRELAGNEYGRLGAGMPIGNGKRYFGSGHFAVDRQAMPLT